MGILRPILLDTAAGALCIAVIAFATIRSASADSGNREVAKGDLISMQGAWTLAHFSYFRSGREEPQPRDQIEGLMTVQGNAYNLKLTLVAQKVDRDYKLKLYPDRQPKAFDVTLPDLQMIQGIYELKGDKLRRCYSQPGTPRPKKFRAGDQTYQVWDRKKPSSK